VLIAIGKKDYLEIDPILQQKNINANAVPLIDRKYAQLVNISELPEQNITDPPTSHW